MDNAPVLRQQLRAHQRPDRVCCRQVLLQENAHLKAQVAVDDVAKKDAAAGESQGSDKAPATPEAVRACPPQLC